MSEISYSTSTEAVDWELLKSDLVADDFDNLRTPEELRRSFESSAVKVFAWHDGRIIGKGRALSDGVCNAYVVDLWTHSTFRRRGIATEMIERIVRNLDGQHVYLFTDEAESFYERIGFVRRGVGYERVIGKWLGRYGPRDPD